MEHYANLFIRWIDIALWQANNYHRDVIAGAVFSKMGGVSMLPVVDNPSEPPSAGTQIEDSEILIGCFSA